MKQYVEIDNRIKIKVPVTEDEKNKTKTESKETTKEVKILTESSRF